MDENEFLDCNEQDSYIYGTTFSSVREVMSENKLCVIDCRPEVSTVFENHRKSLIQHCERSELRLHFESTKVH